MSGKLFLSDISQLLKKILPNIIACTGLYYLNLLSQGYVPLIII